LDITRIRYRYFKNKGLQNELMLEMKQL